MRRVTGKVKLIHHLGGHAACPFCHQPALYREDGAAAAMCGGCGRLIEEKHWNWLVHAALEVGARQAADQAASPGHFPTDS